MKNFKNPKKNLEIQNLKIRTWSKFKDSKCENLENWTLFKISEIQGF